MSQQTADYTGVVSVLGGFFLLRACIVPNISDDASGAVMARMASFLRLLNTTSTLQS
jgi:hypothetical protein